MIKLIKISKYQVRPLVEISYEGDADLFDKYHLSKMEFSGCVDSTMELIEGASREKVLTYYKVLLQKKPIGYVITCPNVLYSYAIAVKYRKKKILMEWWGAVKSLFSGVFATGLYENNTRAILFLQRQGMIIVEKNGNLVTLLNQ